VFGFQFEKTIERPGAAQQRDYVEGHPGSKVIQAHKPIGSGFLDEKAAVDTGIDVQDFAFCLGK
jgi:hypothetical protein